MAGVFYHSVIDGLGFFICFMIKAKKRELGSYSEGDCFMQGFRFVPNLSFM